MRKSSSGLRSSDLEAALLFQIRAAGLPAPEQQFRFAPPRRWRFDFSWLQFQVAVEVDGGTYVYGRHNRPAGFAGDCEKQNAAVLLGWRVLRFTREMVLDGRALAVLEQALKTIS